VVSINENDEVCSLLNKDVFWRFYLLILKPKIVVRLKLKWYKSNSNANYHLAF